MHHWERGLFYQFGKSKVVGTLRVPLYFYPYLRLLVPISG